MGCGGWGLSKGEVWTVGKGPTGLEKALGAVRGEA